MVEKGGNHQLLKQKNSHLIRKYIYQNSPISRVEITRNPAKVMGCFAWGKQVN